MTNVDALRPVKHSEQDPPPRKRQRDEGDDDVVEDVEIQDGATHGGIKSRLMQSQTYSLLRSRAKKRRRSAQPLLTLMIPDACPATRHAFQKNSHHPSSPRRR